MTLIQLYFFLQPSDRVLRSWHEYPFLTPREFHTASPRGEIRANLRETLVIIRIRGSKNEKFARWTPHRTAAGWFLQGERDTPGKLNRKKKTTLHIGEFRRSQEKKTAQQKQKGTSFAAEKWNAKSRKKNTNWERCLDTGYFCFVELVVHGRKPGRRSWAEFLTAHDHIVDGLLNWNYFNED